ncbi:hypothetical protein D3C86_1575370 [compost metagenome]
MNRITLLYKILSAVSGALVGSSVIVSSNIRFPTNPTIMFKADGFFTRILLPDINLRILAS